MQTSPNVLIIGLISIVAILSISFGLSKMKSEQPKKNPVPKVTLVPKVAGTTAPTQSPTPNPTQVPTEMSTPLPTQVPTVETKPSDSSFVYPGAKVLSGNDYESNDNPDAITNWYKDKLKALGYNANSFVVTKTNDKVLNKLVSDNGKNQIRIEISKENASAPVRIKVEIIST